VLRVTIEREPPKKSLTTHFGRVSLKWNKWVCISDAPTKPVWSGRSEVVERLLAHTCELCGAHEHIEVHQIHKLADLTTKGGTQPPASGNPRWCVAAVTSVSNTDATTGQASSVEVTGEPRETETLTRGSERGR
jgi:hypothetical protein